MIRCNFWRILLSCLQINPHIDVKLCRLQVVSVSSAWFFSRKSTCKSWWYNLRVVRVSSTTGLIQAGFVWKRGYPRSFLGVDHHIFCPYSNGNFWGIMWESHNFINTPKVITISMGGMFTIPSHGSCLWHWLSHNIKSYQLTLTHIHLSLPWFSRNVNHCLP